VNALQQVESERERMTGFQKIAIFWLHFWMLLAHDRLTPGGVHKK